MDSDIRGLVDEERERLGERQQIRGDLTKIGKRHRADRSACGAVADLMKIVRVRDRELSVTQREHVELDEIDSGGECGAK